MRIEFSECFTAERYDWCNKLRWLEPGEKSAHHMPASGQLTSTSAQFMGTNDPLATRIVDYAHNRWAFHILGIWFVMDKLGIG